MQALSGVPLLPVTLIICFVFWLGAPKKNFAFPQYILLPLLLLVMFISLLLSPWAAASFAVFNDFGPSVLLFIMFSTSLDTVEQHAISMKVISAITLILAIHGIDQSFTGIGWSGAELSQGTRITYVGILSDPNDLALAFVISLPMFEYARTESKSIISKVFWLAAMLTILYGIFLTNSRGGMLGVLTILLIQLRSKLGTLKMSIVGTICLIGVAMLPTRLNELDATEESAADRLGSWYEGLQMLQKYPMFGVGKGNYTEYHHLTAHNSFVLAFAELGLVGYFLWLSFFALSFYMVYKIGRASTSLDQSTNSRDQSEFAQFQKISRTYFNAMVGFTVCAFFLSRSYVIILFILCALCVGLYQAVNRRWPIAFPSIKFGTFAGFVLLLEFASIFLIYIMVGTLH